MNEVHEVDENEGSDAEEEEEEEEDEAEEEEENNDNPQGDTNKWSYDVNFIEYYYLELWMFKN